MMCLPREELPEINQDFMRYALILILMIPFLSCNHKIDDRNSTNDDTKHENPTEDFEIFFSRFIQDTIFQLQRIDAPLHVVLTDEEVVEDRHIVVKYVSFDREDWDSEIFYSSTRISNDTMNVILQGIDTGLYIEHYFAKRSGKWHLFQIRNSST